MRRPLLISLAVLVLALLPLGYRLLTSRAAVTVGGPFTLIEGDGKTVTERSFPGKWQLIYFGYTHCPDACPTALNAITVALNRLGERATLVQPLFITVDPERDTPSVMKDYAMAFGANLVGLTGSPDAIKAVEREYRVFAEKGPVEQGEYLMNHTSIIYLMDPRGRVASYFAGDVTGDALATALGQQVR